MNLNGPNAYDSVKNPWITYTTDRKLSFNVIEMLFNYPDYEVTDNFYLRAVYNIAELSSSCIAEDSLITLADGSRKLVKDLTGEESLLVWFRSLMDMEKRKQKNGAHRGFLVFYWPSGS